MVNGFYRDLNKAREAELIVQCVMEQLAPEYKYENVGNDREYFHKGDIKAVAANGKAYMIEVKDDSRIHKTGNILCEEEVFYTDCNEWKKGNMYSDYETYCVVSKQDKKIYVIDFSILKSIYRRFDSKYIPHSEQTTFAYLVPLGALRRKGAVIAEIDYTDYWKM